MLFVAHFVFFPSYFSFFPCRDNLFPHFLQMLTLLVSILIVWGVIWRAPIFYYLLSDVSLQYLSVCVYLFAFVCFLSIFFVVCEGFGRRV